MNAFRRVAIHFKTLDVTFLGNFSTTQGIPPQDTPEQSEWTRSKFQSNAQDQLVALHESHGLSGDALQAWCRARGLFAHHLAAWRVAFYETAKAGPGARELRSLKDENDQLKRDLLRKEKALSEAAALLVLQKKFLALWEDEAK